MLYAKFLKLKCCHVINTLHNAYDAEVYVHMLSVCKVIVRGTTAGGKVSFFIIVLYMHG